MLARGSGFALPVPPGWQDRSVVTLVEAPEGGAASASIVVTRDPLPPGTDAAGYARLQETVLRQQAGEGLERLDAAETTLAGEPAAVRTYRWRLQGQVMRQRIWCLVSAGTGLCVTATVAEERFDALADDLSGAVAGLRLE